jgi:uncharacterized membrane protein HdeD (DUF308 family)
LVEEAAAHELAHLQSKWWFLLLLGILLAVCGLVAVSFPPFFTVIAVTLLAAVLFVSGVALVITSFWAGKWSALLVQLLVGILYVMVGMLMMECKEESVKLVTLFVAVMFIVAGIFRIVASLTAKFPQWGWALLNGVLTTLVGIIIFNNLPEAKYWAIGLLVGIEMLFNGVHWIMLALAVRNLPKPEPAG